MLRHVVSAGEAGSRLDQVLAERLARALAGPVSKAALRRAIMAGAVRVDGGVLRRPGFELAVGARLVAEVALEPAARERADQVPPALDPPRVLYEDEWLIAVDKPPGLPLHPTADPRRAHLVGAVKAYLAARRGPGDEPYLGVHQRLDRDTSGVVLFTKDERANAGLAIQFESHAVEKVYLALTRRPARLPARAWSVADMLGRVGRGRMGRVSAGAGGRVARTEFRLLDVRPGLLRVEARPRTGRQHQVRVHLAESGLPILGDEVYGGQARGVQASRAPRLMLHAACLRLRHPVTQAALVIESPPPADFAAVFAAARPGALSCRGAAARRRRR